MMRKYFTGGSLMDSKLRVITLIVFLIIVLITGCVNKGSVNYLELTPKKVTLDIGERQDFAVVVKDKDGKDVDINPSWVLTGEVGTFITSKGKNVTFEATTYGSGTVKVTADGVTAVAEINVQLAESRVDSFLETYQRYFSSKDAENLSNLYKDPFTYISDSLDHPEMMSRADLVSSFENIFSLTDGDIRFGNISIHEDEAIVNGVICLEALSETDQWKATGNVELKISNIDGDLFITQMYEEEKSSV